MRDLNYQLKQMCQRNRDGSYSTQANLARMLNQIANQLQEMGYRRMTTRSLKPKHVDALVKRWLSEGMAAGTIKNRMNCLRWWASKVDRRNVVARSNDFYGIPDRQFVSDESKAVVVDDDTLSRVKDDHVRMSLELQRAFSLRREEAIKFMPGFADQGDHIRLKASWTKGVPGAHPHAGTTHRVRSCPPPRGNRFPYPPAKKLHPTVAHLRTPYHPGGAVKTSRPAACLCANALSAANGLGLSHCWWTGLNDAER